MGATGSSDPPALRVRSVLGRMTDGVSPDRLSRSRVDVLRLNQSEAPRMMAAVVDAHAFEGVSCSFAPGEEIAATLAPRDARLLFAGAGGHRYDAAPRSGHEEGG